MSDSEDSYEMEDYDEEQDLCPECNSRDVFVRDEDAPTYGKRVCECSTCTYDWLEPAPLSRFAMGIAWAWKARTKRAMRTVSAWRVDRRHASGGANERI